MAEANKKENFFVRTGKRIARWFREMRSELKKVVWPSKSQMINNTLIVDVSGSIEYNDSYYSYKAGKPSRIGSSSIDYNDNYYSYKAGKIRSI